MLYKYIVDLNFAWRMCLCGESVREGIKKILYFCIIIELQQHSVGVIINNLLYIC